jgi:hypothetical protein
MRPNKYIDPDANIVHMLGDNMGAIALTKNPHLNDRPKYIDICDNCAVSRILGSQVNISPEYNMIPILRRFLYWIIFGNIVLLIQCNLLDMTDSEWDEG